MESKCLLSGREGRLARLRLNRPDVRNALNRELCEALIVETTRANEDISIGAILLEGEGRVFCAGMDLKEDPGPNLGALHAELFSIGSRLRKPMVAAVQGAAIAGGLGLALTAHVVLAGSDAKFGLTETRIGLWPYTIYPILLAAVGRRRAMELAITARIVDAETAQRLGFVEHVVAPVEVEAKALDVATALAAGSAEAVANGLSYAREIERMPMADALQHAARRRAQAQDSADFAEGVRAFREKRVPQWPSHTE